MRRCVLALLFLVAACGDGGRDTTLTVLAASSLTEPFAAVAAAYEDEHPDTDVVTSFGSSARLVAQVEAGAPADVVLTADATTAARLPVTGVIDPATRAVLFSPFGPPIRTLP